jgi:hypothetical protein
MTQKNLANVNKSYMGIYTDKKTVVTCCCCWQWQFEMIGNFLLKLHRSVKFSGPHYVCTWAIDIEIKKIDGLRLVMCPLLALPHPRLFLPRPFIILLSQTRQAVCAIKHSISLDFYDMSNWKNFPQMSKCWPLMWIHWCVWMKGISCKKSFFSIPANVHFLQFFKVGLNKGFGKIVNKVEHDSY